jgi:hypothetical protein
MYNYANPFRRWLRIGKAEFEKYNHVFDEVSGTMTTNLNQSRK